jgi:hypothetical protein
MNRARRMAPTETAIFVPRKRPSELLLEWGREEGEGVVILTWEEGEGVVRLTWEEGEGVVILTWEEGEGVVILTWVVENGSPWRDRMSPRPGVWTQPA